MKKILVCLISLTLITLHAKSQFIDANKNGKMDIYENPEADIEKRIDDLLNQMNLDEKVAQITSVAEVQLDNQKGDESRRILEKEDIKNGVGQLSRSGEKLTPEQTVAKINALQDFLINNTRLGIPAIIHEECLHGVMMEGATIFPQAIGMASSWNPALVEEVGSAIAKEVRSRGSNLALTPTIDLGRDPRYGRIEETYGEDPYLTSRLAVALINGFQGKNKIIGKDHIAATVKHFGGSAQPLGGLNQSVNYMSERTMRETELVAFKAAVQEANVASVMASYAEYDGISCHINHWLLRDVLRDEWGFKGMVVSDYGGINHVVSSHHNAATSEEATRMAIQAGVDADLPNGESFKQLKKLIESGEADEKYVDSAVRNVLRTKFRLGLFENAFADAQYALKVNNSKEHRELALKAAHESIVLLKNENQILPIDLFKVKNIAVIGPNANQVHFGSYSTELSQKRGVTIYEGVKNYVGERATVKYAEGCKIHLGNGYWRSPEAELNSEESDLKMIKEAVELANQSDVVILAIGCTPRICRENIGNRIGDRHELTLFGRQQLLVDEMMKTGKPVVVYLMNGRPLSITKIKEDVPAIIEGWYMGEETGNAVADILFGKVNPSGKLPVSFPRSAGHLPSYYNKKPSALKQRYILELNEPLFPFGYGLSYTTFEYTDLRLEDAEINTGQITTLSVTVTNTGNYDGKEVVQMYIRDNYSSVSRPVIELKGCEKVSLKSGESKKITFDITPDKLKFYNKEMKEVVEPGEFTLSVGSNSGELKSVTLNVSNKLK